MAIAENIWEIADTSAPPPPLVPGLPVLGQAMQLSGDMSRFLVEAYHQYGPAFRIRVINNEYTILAGIEANNLLSKVGNDLFTGAVFFGGFGAELGEGAFLPAMEGPEHRNLRKILRPAYAKQAIEPHLDQIIAITESHIAQWARQPSVHIVPAMQRLVTDQLGIVLGGRSLGDYFPYVRDFLRTIVQVTMLGTRPRLLLKSPWYLKAREKTRQFILELIHDHAAHPHGGDLIDTALAARTLEDAAYTEDDQVLIAIGAYVAGMDTLANTLSFMLYALLKHPAVLNAVREETTALLSEGLRSVRDLRGLETLHGAAIETLRMYAIAAVTMRTALQPFTFAGYSIPQGANVMIANTVTHFLPEYFPEPDQFRIDRDFTNIPANVFTPFTLGAHTCLGAGMAEALLMLTAGIIASRARIQLDPVNAKARISSTPAPNPGAHLKMRVTLPAAQSPS